MIKSLFNLILFCNVLLCYYKQDPIMISLSGAYNTEAHGYQSVGINPANLAFNQATSFNFFNMNLNMQNNFLTNDRIGNINGANLEDVNADNYFPKEDILNYLGESNIKLGAIGNFPMPMLNFSSKNFSINSEVKFISTSEFSPDIFEMVLEGNEVNREYDLSIENRNILIWELSYTKSFNLDPIGIGFTVKYLKGLLYYSLDPIQDSYIQTSLTEISSQGRYLLRQNTHGQGLSLDLGFTTKRNESGWKFGLSLINLFGNIKWNHKTTSDDIFLKFYDALPYNSGESYLINLSIDNLTLDVLNNVNTSDIYSADGEKVYEYSDQPIDIESFFHTEEDVEYYCSNDNCSSYFVNSEIASDLDNMQYQTVNLDYPTIMSFGASRQINKNKYVVFDLSSGFDNSFGNVRKWRLAFGYIFGKDRFPLRLGASYGGYDKKSFGFGWGVKLGKFNFDVGIGLKGSLDIDKSNVLDLGFNMYWMKL